jgi:enoyl-CoA hydratase
MLIAGELLDAEQALAGGLVDQAHPSEGVLEAALSLAEQIGRRSWRALELTKLALLLHRPSTSAFDTVAQGLLFESDEKQTRMQAFLDRKMKKDTSTSAQPREHG